MAKYRSVYIIMSEKRLVHLRADLDTLWKINAKKVKDRTRNHMAFVTWSKFMRLKIGKFSLDQSGWKISSILTRKDLHKITETFQTLLSPKLQGANFENTASASRWSYWSIGETVWNLYFFTKAYQNSEECIHLIF